ncbi:MAG: phage tail protein [Oscillospiraceae bacterium]|nr:phage tail protein [Oscillospiraceae bacterium]
MIPCLYDISETEFKTNGIGKLADCISCVVTEKRNGSYELKMEYPKDGIHADKLVNGNVVTATPSYGTAVQAFRIYKVSTSMTGNIEISARHISYQLSYITVSPCAMVPDYTSDDYEGTCRYAWDVLTEHASTDVPFTFETDVEGDAVFNISEPTTFRSALGGIEGSMLDTFGGEYEWDNYCVKFWKSRGSDKGVKITYGKNLKDFQKEESIEDTITGIHPYWMDSDTGELLELSQKVVTLSDIGIETDAPFEKIALLDCSDQFEEMPTEYQLLQYAQSYLESTTSVDPSIDMTIDFASLWELPEYKDIVEAESVNLCDKITVYCPILNMTVKTTVTETEWDVLLGRYKSLTLSTSATSSRNSSLQLTLATTEDVRSQIAVADNAIRLSVTKTLSDYSTTEQVKSLIETSEEGILLEVSETYVTSESLGNYVEEDEIRSRFAMDPTSITVESGVISFTSNSISIDSDNFKLTSSGEVMATGTFTSGSDDAFKMQMSGGWLSGYYLGSYVGSIMMVPNKPFTIDGYTQTYNALTVQAEDITLESTLIDFNADYLNVSYAAGSYYYGGTGSISVLTGVSYWASYNCISNMTMYSDSSGYIYFAQWDNNTISVPASFSSIYIQFQKGLMVTSL